MPWLLLILAMGALVILKMRGRRAVAAWLGMGVAVMMGVAVVASGLAQDVAQLSETEIAACQWTSVGGLALGTAALRRIGVL